MPWWSCLHAWISQTHYATEIIIEDLCLSNFAVVLILHNQVADSQIWVAKLSLQVTGAKLNWTAVVDRCEILNLIAVDPSICASCVEYTINRLILNVDGACVRIWHFSKRDLRLELCRLFKLD